ncbi:MAG: hypothetical protein M1826_002499 [Phylliscum demangeonii]|nr:MAG: hypothetical protein M1826_002499 [Phylliscum demangeonii]
MAGASPHPDDAPTPTPPPAPGHRAQRLQTIFHEALAHTIKTISYEHFASCFPTVAAACPDSLRAVWQQMRARFEELARSEFEEILRERDAVRLLNELDGLVARASQDKEAAERGLGQGEDGGRPPAPHTLPPSAILAAHLAPLLAGEGAKLQAQLQTVQEENVGLMQTLATQRQEMARLVAELESVVADLDGAAHELDAVVRAPDFAADIDAMDEEWRRARPG